MSTQSGHIRLVGNERADELAEKGEGTTLYEATTQENQIERLREMYLGNFPATKKFRVFISF